MQTESAVRELAQQLGWVDLLGLGLVGVFGILGIIRGLWWQVFRLLGIVIAIVLARTLSPRWGPVVGDWLPDVSLGLAHGLTWFGLFLAGLVAASLLGNLGKKSLEAMKLGLVDRFGGLLAGALTGLLIHSAILVALCELTGPSWSQRTIGESYSRSVLDVLGARVHLIVDAHAAERLRPWLDGRPTGSEVEVEPAPSGERRVR